MTATAPRISIVVPLYNGERYIRRSIDSLLSQNYPRERYEVIVVDNNSTDRSAAIAAEYDGVKVLPEPVTGSYAARNTGISAASGEIIATIDPDCVAAPTWLAVIAGEMEDPGCMVLLGHQRHPPGSDALHLLELYEAEKIAYVTERRQKELYFGYTNNMAFRRTVFDSVGLFPEQIRGGDTVFVRRVVDALGCEVVRYNPAMEITHLEVESVNAYYAKRAVYGKSNERISQQLPFRPLWNSERWAVFKKVARKNHFSLKRALMLLALLAPGALIYETGRRKGRLSRHSDNGS